LFQNFIILHDVNYS